jgi:hypothetical protein
MGVVALAENRLGSMTLQGIAIPTALAVVLGPECRYQALRIRRTAARPPIELSPTLGHEAVSTGWLRTSWEQDETHPAERQCSGRRPPRGAGALANLEIPPVILPNRAR